MTDERRTISGALCLPFLFLFLLSSLSADQLILPAEIPDEIRIKAHAEKAPVPLFFDVSVKQLSRQTAFAEFAHEFSVEGVILQSDQKEESVLSLEWKGAGEIKKLEGEGVISWSLRAEPAKETKKGNERKRFLDVVMAKGTKGFLLKMTAQTKMDFDDPSLSYRFDFPHLLKGEAAGFSSRVDVHGADGFHLQNLEAKGFAPLEVGEKVRSHQAMTSATGGRLVFSVESNGVFVGGVDVRALSLNGEVVEEGEKPYARIQLEMVVEVREGGAKFPLLEGRGLALENLPSSLRLKVEDKGKGLSRYVLESDEAGEHQVSFSFLAPVSKGLERGFNFRMLNGHIIPLHLSGLGNEIEFSKEGHFRPALSGGKWNGFCPSGKDLSVLWQKKSERAGSGKGALFFNSESKEEVILKAGLLEQKWVIENKILQGEIQKLEYELSGEGEILKVEAPQLLEWTLKAGEKGKRLLVVKLTRPEKKGLGVVITSQSPLGAFPLQVIPLQITPKGAARHTGYVKVKPAGAVHVELADLQGLTQLSPNQWPGDAQKKKADLSAERFFVYRYPLSKRSYRLLADQIQAQVDVSQILSYELGASDRLIRADVELDISEASLREWDILIPADYSVVAVTGPEVADYVVSTKKEKNEGDHYETLGLKVIFLRDIKGRQLVNLHLEKNEAAKVGDWALKPLRHPLAETIRGTVGVAVAPGFRAKEAKITKLSEKPLSHFPKRLAGLQQVYRIRESGWLASMTVQKLPQSVQSDLYHLHSLKDGIDYASVVVNYFVTGAPVEEWKLSLPKGAGNVSVEGRDIRTSRHKDGLLDIKLQQPVLGSYTLLVTYEKEIGAQGGTLKAGQVSPLDVRNERGFVQVVSPVQVRHKMKSAGKGLLKLDLLELPAEYRLLTSAPTLATYQYTARPFDLEMEVEWFDPAETLAQIVDFTEATSRVSRDGEVVTDLSYHLKSRGANVLRVTLPHAVPIWEIQVNGESVNARSDGRDTLIPLPGGLGANDEIIVSLRIGQQAERATHIPLQLPVLSTPVLKLAWEVKSDRGQVMWVKSGTLSQGQAGTSPNGLTWLAGEGRWLAILIILSLTLSWWFLRKSPEGSWLRKLSFVCLTAAASFCLFSILYAAVPQAQATTQGESVLNFSPKLIDAGKDVSVVLENRDAKVKSSSTMSWWAWIFIFLGVVLFLAPRFLASQKKNERWFKWVGGVCLILGCLLHHSGAFWFYLIYLLVLALSVVPLLRSWKDRKDQEEPLLDEDDPPPPVNTNPQVLDREESGE